MAETLSTRSLSMLLARIIEEEERRTHALKNASDWPDLKYRSGWLDCFEFIKGLCDDVERDLYGGNQKK